MNLLETSALGRWLQHNNAEYFSSAQGLRRTIERWLRYVTQTFPHYTSHAVDHSDNIIAWLSHVLFKDDDPEQPVVGLSGIEAYALMAAAYLHDAGMVVSDTEKRTILASDEWTRWVETQMSQQWMDVQKLRDEGTAQNSAEKHFLADLHTRHLIAEFVRRVHHKRAARIVAGYREYLAEYFFHEPMLEQIVSDICVAHGLSHHDLQDENRYPQRTLLRHEYANVRWLAILLRLGDLLDMRTDRACPLLLNAASPLPQDSIAHWEQYAAIKTFDVGPDVIQIRAECTTKEQYQALRDWCHWIELEAGNAATLMTHAKRHAGWNPPGALLSGPAPTIKIEKAEGATFFIDDWKFELDQNTIFERLIKDVYDEPLAFVRELLQNAFDATRVQLYLDLAATGRPKPASPTQVDEQLREQYPIELELETRPYRPDPASPEEARQFLIVTDHGVGMDRDVISRYLLQIGRSFYRSDEFLKAFSFVPTSRFGIGFLSVFAVSDHVVVDTYKPSSGDGAIQLSLRGARSYVLPQRSNRRERGTRIEILLRDPLRVEDLGSFVKKMCRRVEFAVRVVGKDGVEMIRAEKSSDLVYDIPSLDNDGGSYVLRTFPICVEGLEGEIYIPAHRIGEHENWAFDIANYNDAHPFNTIPRYDSEYLLHGIHFGKPDTSLSKTWFTRIDLRRDPSRFTLSRSGRHIAHLLDVTSRISAIVQQHVEESLVRRPDDWSYRLDLLSRFPAAKEYWLTVPRLIPVDGDEKHLMALDDVRAIPSIDVVTYQTLTSQRKTKKLWQRSFPLIEHQRLLLGLASRWILEGRQPSNVTFRDDQPIVTWSQPDDQKIIRGERATAVLCTFAVPSVAAIRLIEKTILAVNINHPFGKWLVRVRDAAEQSAHITHRHLFELIFHLIHEGDPSAPTLAAWRAADLPRRLKPPLVELVDRILYQTPPRTGSLP